MNDKVIVLNYDIANALRWLRFYNNEINRLTAEVNQLKEVITREGKSATVVIFTESRVAAVQLKATQKALRQSKKNYDYFARQLAKSLIAIELTDRELEAICDNELAEGEQPNG